MKNTLLLSILFFVQTTIIFCEVPQLMNYQGVLLDDSGEPVQNDVYQIRFLLYNQESGGNILWSETQDVTTNNGIFRVLLGTLNPITSFPSETAWLGIKVGTNPEMVPRKQIASIGYAFESDNSQSLQGYNASDFMLNSEHIEPITSYGSIGSVSVPSLEWTTLIQIDVVLPVEMMLCSFGTVSGAGWVDGTRMLQLSLYNANWSQFYAYSNPWVILQLLIIFYQQDYIICNSMD